MTGGGITGLNCAALIAGLTMALSACEGNADMAGDSDEGKPVTGFYSVQTTTSDDSCDLPPLDAPTEQLVAAGDASVNFAIWPIDREDVPWGGLPSTMIARCEVSFAVTMSELTPHTFVADETWNWQDPSTCTPLEFMVLPKAPCALKMRLAFDLLAACPTKFNGISCQ